MMTTDVCFEFSIMLRLLGQLYQIIFLQILGWAEFSLGLSIAFPIEKQRKIRNSGSDFLWLEGPSENNGILN